MNTTPRIYVACLASYTNGVLFGKWFDATQDSDDLENNIKVMLAKSPMPEAEEWAIHDHEGFGGAPIGEYDDLNTVSTLAKLIAEHGQVAGNVYAYYQDIGETETALTDNYQGVYKSEEDFAESIFTECYDIPKHLENYIDYERVARDMFLGGDYISFEVDGEYHIFASR